MAGAGYKLFNTGDVLTAAQVNTYLNEQTVMVFASSTARTTALSGVLAEGMVSYLQDTNAVEVYNGSAWVGVGNVGDITEVQAGVGISVASGTGPIPVITNSSTDLITTAGDLLYGTAADTVARLGIGTAGQVLKVNSGATAPEWGAASSTATFVGCEIRKTANQAATQSAYTTVTWNTETFDTDSFHDNSTNNSRITIPSGKGGYYLVYWNIGLTGDGAVAVSLDKNGSAYKRAGGYKTGGGTGYFANTEIISLVATDYIEVAIYTTSSGLNIESDAANTKQSTFGVSFLGV